MPVVTSVFSFDPFASVRLKPPPTPIKKEEPKLIFARFEEKNDDLWLGSCNGCGSVKNIWGIGFTFFKLHLRLCIRCLKELKTQTTKRRSNRDNHAKKKTDKPASRSKPRTKGKPAVAAKKDSGGKNSTRSKPRRKG